MSQNFALKNYIQIVKHHLKSMFQDFKILMAFKTGKRKRKLIFKSKDKKVKENAVFIHKK